MKIAAYTYQNIHYVGLLTPDGEHVQPYLFSKEKAALGVLAVIQAQQAQALPDLGATVPLSSVTLRAPMPQPRRNVFCVGKNYAAHAKEFAQSGFDASAGKAADDIPAHPIIFSKVPESVIATGEAIRVPVGVSEAIDYEAELGVIIGLGGKGISAADAMNHVWGYTVINDVTARDWQNRHLQWHMGKSFDTFCPMGPVAVSADALDGQNTRVRLWVNGELRQDAPTTDLIFDIPTLIATLSAGITLLPGDVIATGTPVGVGIGFKPPKYLRAGDLVRVEIDGIGAIENPVL